MASWWRRPPAARPITCRSTDRSCRSVPGALALTPISSFRPAALARRDPAEIGESALHHPRAAAPPGQRTADFAEVRDISEVKIREDQSILMKLLFDPEHHLEERILREQFMA